MCIDCGAASKRRKTQIAIEWANLAAFKNAPTLHGYRKLAELYEQVDRLDLAKELSMMDWLNLQKTCLCSNLCAELPKQQESQICWTRRMPT